MLYDRSFTVFVIFGNKCSRGSSRSLSVVLEVNLQNSTRIAAAIMMKYIFHSVASHHMHTQVEKEFFWRLWEPYWPPGTGVRGRGSEKGADAVMEQTYVWPGGGMTQSSKQSKTLEMTLPLSSEVSFLLPLVS